MPRDEIGAARSSADQLPGEVTSRVARVRFWMILMPMHLVAFSILYFATLQLLETGFQYAGEEAAKQRLDLAIDQLPFFAPYLEQGLGRHLFDHYIVAHLSMGLRLYDVHARPLTSSAAGVPVGPRKSKLLSFLAAEDEGKEVWLESAGDRTLMHGLTRIKTTENCVGCHERGQTRGVASMTVDYTEQLAIVRARLRRNLALLLVVWGLLVGVSTVLAKRTSLRSAARIEAELAAAAAGEDPLDESGGRSFVFDPVTAELHAGLRSVLRRQRAREAHVAERLAHADQLASLGQVAAGVAHEIKNPLAGIQGALEVLRTDVEDEAVKRLYGEMLGELERVNRTIGMLLATGRPSPPRLVRTDLRALLEEIHNLLQHGLRRQGVHFEIKVGESLPQMFLDDGKVRQVILNLVNNAAEAIDGEGVVTVRAGALPDGGGVVIAVEDNGPGISAEDQERVFEPFYTSKFSGTGLGLAIAKTLVEQHEGRLEVSSEPGLGTSFFIILPAREEAVAEPAAVSEAG